MSSVLACSVETVSEVAAFLTLKPLMREVVALGVKVRIRAPVCCSLGMRRCQPICAIGWRPRATFSGIGLVVPTSTSRRWTCSTRWAPRPNWSPPRPERGRPCASWSVTSGRMVAPSPLIARRRRGRVWANRRHGHV